MALQWPRSQVIVDIPPQSAQSRRGLGDPGHHRHWKDETQLREGSEFGPKTSQKEPSTVWSPGGRLGLSPLFPIKVPPPRGGVRRKGEFPQAGPGSPIVFLEKYAFSS